MDMFTQKMKHKFNAKNNATSVTTLIYTFSFIFVAVVDHNIRKYTECQRH